MILLKSVWDAITLINTTYFPLVMPKVLVIGGGPGGYTAAETASHNGAEVILFEKERLGGTCGIWGCIPTKTLVTTASAILDKDRLKMQGLDIEYKLDIDILKNLKDRNIEIDVRDVPTTEKKDIFELLKEKGLL